MKAEAIWNGISILVGMRDSYPTRLSKDSRTVCNLISLFRIRWPVRYKYDAKFKKSIVLLVHALSSRLRRPFNFSHPNSVPQKKEGFPDLTAPTRQHESDDAALVFHVPRITAPVHAVRSRRRKKTKEAQMNSNWRAAGAEIIK